METANAKLPNMNEGNSRSTTNLTSSGSSNGDIHEIEMPDGSTQLTITSVLNYCKNKILNPYLRLLSFVGLRPVVTDYHEPSVIISVINYFYITIFTALLVIGYVLQYMACFRRERGFCYKIAGGTYMFETEATRVYEQICHASLMFSFIVPSVLHFTGYMYTVSILRQTGDDHLPILMERVFLASTNLLNGYACQKSLVRKLWIFVALSIIWMSLSLFSVSYMMAEGNIYFKWMDNGPYISLVILKVFLIVSTLLHDMVQATIISNYCLQAQLLTSYVQFLREKLLQYPIQPLEWMRDIEEFKKMLKYFNQEISPSVCVFTIINICYSLSGILWLLKYDHVDLKTLPIVGISILNVSLWIFIAAAPFIQAARLSVTCDLLKEAGQEVRIRPFAHQDTPICELDSVLLYTSSLNINAKLFYLPITGKYLCLFITLLSISIIVLGQCHFLIYSNVL